MSFVSFTLPRWRNVAGTVLAAAVLTCSGQAYVITGDVNEGPWDSYNNLYVGKTSRGTLEIFAEEELSISSISYIGKEASGDGEVTVSGAGATWSGYPIVVGDYGTAKLTISDGGQVNRVSSIASNQGSNATVIVTGSGSHMVTHGGLTVGGIGTGTLLINDGGVVTASTGNDNNIGDGNNKSGVQGRGTVTVSGAGSEWNAGPIAVGAMGFGTLTIEEGGKVTSAGGATLGGGGQTTGAQLKGTGVATVTGAGSLWNVKSGMTVGSFGDGTLIIENGGQVKVTPRDFGVSSVTTIGSFRGSHGTVTVSGEGSHWNVDNGLNLRIGRAGTGTLTIDNGATAFHSAGSSYAMSGVVIGGDFSQGTGLNAPGVGTVLVTGAGSQWNVEESYDFWVGSFGTGSLTIADGGRVVANNVTRSRIGTGEDGYGKVIVTGGSASHLHSEWITDSVIEMGVDGGTGSLVIASGGRVTSDAVVIGTAAVDSRDRRSHASVSGAGSQWTVHGTFELGSIAEGQSQGAYRHGLYVYEGGQVNVHGSLTIGSSGQLNIEVRDTGGVSVGGDVHNDGVVQLTAGAHLAAGSYRPLYTEHGTHSGEGSYQAFGGRWDRDLQLFIVSAAQNLGSGQSGLVDLLDGQRLIVAGQRSDVLVGFDAEAVNTNGGSEIAFTAVENNMSTLHGEQVLSAWDFTTDLDYRYHTLLSFFIGENWDAEMFTIWHSDDGQLWSVLDVESVYEEGVVSFMVEGFSSYALTAVPEPHTYALALALSAVGVAVYRRRRVRAQR